jgi:hypothetical protein
LFELSATTVPENEHPELEPLRLPLELMVTVAATLSSNAPVQAPEIAEREAVVL